MKIKRFYRELSVDSHLPNHDNNCAVWEIFGKRFLSKDKRNLVKLYAFLLNINLIHTNMTTFSFIYKKQVFGGKLGEMLEVLEFYHYF